MYIAVGIVDATDQSVTGEWKLTYEQVKYFYIFDTEAQANEFVEKVYRTRTASRWEVLDVEPSASVDDAIQTHMIDSTEEGGAILK